jgi:hypothetical protein
MRVEVEPAVIAQPDRLSRQQRRANERKQAKQLKAQNNRIAILTAARQRPAARELKKLEEQQKQAKQAS